MVGSKNPLQNFLKGIFVQKGSSGTGFDHGQFEIQTFPIYPRPNKYGRTHHIGSLVVVSFFLFLFFLHLHSWNYAEIRNCSFKSSEIRTAFLSLVSVEVYLSHWWSCCRMCLLNVKWVSSRLVSMANHLAILGWLNFASGLEFFSLRLPKLSFFCRESNYFSFTDKFWNALQDFNWQVQQF